MHFTARIACCLALALSLNGCSKFSMPEMPSFSFGLPKLPGIHKFDIQQGNVITQDMIDQLKPGMTKSQVRYVMGTPLVADTFNQNRWDYFYSLHKGGGEEVRERVAIFFENDLLVGLRGDFIPGSGAKPESPAPANTVPTNTADEIPNEEASETAL
jgi:outer membrane protein assembly factor BamE